MAVALAEALPPFVATAMACASPAAASEQIISEQAAAMVSVRFIVFLLILWRAGRRFRALWPLISASAAEFLRRLLDGQARAVIQ
jgi:hypothetical protein